MASATVRDNLRLPRPWADPQAAQLAAFIRADEQAKGKMERLLFAEQNPAMFEAHELFKLPPDHGVRLAAESLLLAGENVAFIAAYCGYSCETMRLYHDLFFDVQDRLQFPGLIVHQAVCRGDDECEATVVRRASYFGGRQVALGLLHPAFGPVRQQGTSPLGVHDIRNSIAAKAMLAVRMMDASDPRTAAALAKFWLRLQMLLRRQRAWKEEQAATRRALSDGLRETARMLTSARANGLPA